MQTNVILTNKRRIYAQSNAKLKAWFRRLLRHPVRKRSGPILHPRTHMGERLLISVSGNVLALSVNFVVKHAYAVKKI